MFYIRCICGETYNTWINQKICGRRKLCVSSVNVEEPIQFTKWETERNAMKSHRTTFSNLLFIKCQTLCTTVCNYFQRFVCQPFQIITIRVSYYSLSQSNHMYCMHAAHTDLWLCVSYFAFPLLLCAESCSIWKLFVLSSLPFISLKGASIKIKNIFVSFVNNVQWIRTKSNSFLINATLARIQSARCFSPFTFSFACVKWIFNWSSVTEIRWILRIQCLNWNIRRIALLEEQTTI